MAANENGRAYVVLQQVSFDETDAPIEQGTFWKVVDTIEAASAEHAVRYAAERANVEGEVTYVAIPTRSWKPTPIKTERTLRVVVS